MEVQENGSSFLEISKEIVANFIQSVVAVDDRMRFSERPASQAVTELDEPEEELLGAADEITIAASTTEEQEHNLYYQDLSSAFAKKGIVCSGFQPVISDSETTINSIVASSKNADVTILDWQMDGSQEAGTLATSAINEIIKSDINECGRLRLITIYTADNSMNVLEALRHSLTEHNPFINDDFICFNDDILKFCKIDVVGKENTESSLTDKIIISFAKLTAGLLSNAALSAVTDLRNRTHNILFKFNRNLDPAYLSHVLGLISSPDMREQAHEVAFDYAVELLSEELKSELQTSKIVKDALSRDTLTQWPNYANSANVEEYFGLKIGKSDVVRFGSDRMSRLLTIKDKVQLQAVLNEGPKLAAIEGKEPLDVFKKENIELTTVDNNNATTHHLELSAIQCVRRDIKTNGEHIPVLKQGTILKSGKNYYVCIQPLCDSVRLTEDTNFTFMRISKADANKPFSHVIRANSSHIRLAVRPTSKEINVFKFSPCSETKVIRSEKDDCKFIFKEKISNSDFEWCAEFKHSVAQEIVNSISASLARVGFDSFEWLRMKAG